MLILQMPPPGLVPRDQWGIGAPGYAKVFGLTIGVNSMRGMERALGSGIVMPGNSADSAREWRLQGALITADGFLRENGSHTWESLEVSGWRSRLDALPHFRPWTGTIGSLRRGMSLAEVRRRVGKGWSLDRRGLLTRWDRRRVVTRFGPRTLHYGAWLGFRSGGLESLCLQCESAEPAMR